MFKKGKSGNAKGRPKGSKDRYSKELVARMKEEGFTEPLDGMLAIANDPECDAELRLMAWKSAAPYVHKRKPQALEVTGAFEFLSADERKMRRNLLLEEIRARQARASAQPKLPSEN